jgi:hypothetical protein
MPAGCRRKGDCLPAIHPMFAADTQLLQGWSILVEPAVQGLHVYQHTTTTTYPPWKIQGLHNTADAG